MYEQHETASDEIISEEPFLLGVSFVCLFVFCEDRNLDGQVVGGQGK